MATRTSPKLALYLAAAACTFTSARAEDVATPPTPATDSGAARVDAPRRDGESARLKVSTPLDAFFTSNLFHVQDRRLNGFDGNTSPGERFDGIDALWDVVLRPAARAALELPLGRKRHLDLGAGFDYFLHQNNRIANYPRLVAAGAVQIGHHDEVALEAKWVRRRFAKNHRDPEALTNGNAVFEHDYVGEFDVVATYDREWSRAVATRLEYELETEAHEDPFQNRDSTSHEGRASLLLGLLKGGRVHLGGGVGVSSSPAELERRRNPLDTLDPSLPTVSVAVDRSYRDVLVAGGVHFAASHAAELEVDLEIRNRSFTTGNSRDETYFGRVDRRLQLGLELTRKIVRGVSLAAFGSFTRNYSNRSDPDLTADEAGYSEIVLGAAATWRFSTGR